MVIVMTLQVILQNDNLHLILAPLFHHFPEIQRLIQIKHASLKGAECGIYWLFDSGKKDGFNDLAPEFSRP